MTLLQDNTFKSIQENGVPLAILNNGNDSLGNVITKSLSNSKMFKINIIKPQYGIEKKIRGEILSGKYQIGIIIPDSTTIKLKRNIYRNIAIAFSGKPELFPRQSDSAGILILIDPTTKASLKSTIASNIREFTKEAEDNVAFNEINRALQNIQQYKKININQAHVISCKEQYALPEQSKIIPNSVQHNVPAWSLFAMFFIVISLASNMIREREEGSFGRLMNMPCNYAIYLMAKVITYLFVCLIQFGIMIFVGVRIMPLVDLPALEIGSHHIALCLIAIASAFAAISYGITIGTIAVSHQQAANFGSVSVVILAAIGGIWVPVFAMPPIMRTLSAFSPLNWSLEGFYDVFIRNQGINGVLPEILKLFFFTVGCMVISIIYFWYKKK